MLSSLFTPQTDQRKTIQSTPGTYSNVIQGLSLNPNFRYTSAETPMGTDPWQDAFQNSNVLGDGMTPGTIQSYGDPANPSYWRVSRNTGGDNYQTRTFTKNPDGTFSWKGSWNNKVKESGMKQFTNALMLAAAGAGLGALMTPAAGAAAAGAAGGGAGAGATGGGLSLGTGSGLVGTGEGLALGGGSGLTGTGAGLSLGAPTAGSAIGGGIGSSIPAASSLPGWLGGGTAGGAAGGGSLIGAGVNKLGGSLASNLVGKVLGGGSGGISNMGNLGSLFTNYKNYSNMGKLIDEIKSIYKPDGEYAKWMENQLARKDAASGRNSQYGPRYAELMGRLGDSQARALSGLGGMMATQQGGLQGMVGAGSRLMDGLGIPQTLMDLFKGGMSGGSSGGNLMDLWDRAPDNADLDYWSDLWGD